MPRPPRPPPLPFQNFHGDPGISELARGTLVVFDPPGPEGPQKPPNADSHGTATAQIGSPRGPDLCRGCAMGISVWRFWGGPRAARGRKPQGPPLCFRPGLALERKSAVYGHTVDSAVRRLLQNNRLLDNSRSLSVSACFDSNRRCSSSAIRASCSSLHSLYSFHCASLTSTSVSVSE